MELRSEDFGLRGESLELKENLKGEALITFKGVNLNRKEKNGNEKFGSADAVFLKEGFVSIWFISGFLAMWKII